TESRRRSGPQRTRSDRGSTGVAIGAGEHQCSGTLLVQAASTNSGTGKFQRGVCLYDAKIGCTRSCRETTISRDAPAGIIQPVAVEDEVRRIRARRANAAGFSAVCDAINTQQTRYGRNAGIGVITATECLCEVACSARKASRSGDRTGKYGRSTRSRECVCTKVNRAVASDAAGSYIEAAKIERGPA